MKLHILSDLHLEFSSFDPIKTDADAIVLAGDIWKGAQGIQWAAETFPGKVIVYVPGNHEFYGKERANTLAAMRIVARECGVHLLDNDELILGVSLGGVRILGATLWTDFELHGADEMSWSMHEARRCLSDFRVIHEGSDSLFSPMHSVKLHQQSLAWLKDKLNEPFDGETIVVSHHLPSKLSVAERYKNDALSACFASNLDDLFGRMDMWIHGHTHDNFDYVANGTRVICNPRGYVTYRGTENVDFDPRMVVEV